MWIRRSGGQLHLVALETEKLGKDCGHGGVGLAGLWRGGGLDLNAITLAAGDAIAASAGDDFDVEDDRFHRFDWFMMREIHQAQEHSVSDETNYPSRRGMLKRAATVGAAVFGAGHLTAFAANSVDLRFLRVLLREADHSPLDSTRMRQLDARDLQGDPLPQAIVSAEGRVRIALVDEPIVVMTRLKAPGFGEINCFADNAGAGCRSLRRSILWSMRG